MWSPRDAGLLFGEPERLRPAGWIGTWPAQFVISLHATPFLERRLFRLRASLYTDQPANPFVEMAACARYANFRGLTKGLLQEGRIVVRG